MTIVKQKPVYINNLFDDFFGSLTTQNEFNHFAKQTNIHETTEGYHLEMNAPGRNKEDFKINADKGLLTISYDKKETAEKSNYKTLRREFSVKSFKRSFQLDDNINVDAIQAKYDAGVLNIFLPKKDEVKVQPKEINIL
ncbi:MAG: Hsp20/alpha crystallin family protein [Bacteroidetes bacterium]|nr:Hsp20/alpha crystallin family protein [Bacteroidota bacterium]